jgi:hypothetical protein
MVSSRFPSHPFRGRRTLLGWSLVGAAFAGPLGPLAPLGPLRAAADDELLLVSTRRIGTRCEPTALPAGLECLRFARDANGGRWEKLAWSEVRTILARPLPIVVYVHGNRVDRGTDRAHGLMAYRALARAAADEQPRRYVIWSWPSDRIPGPLKDYHVKASRTRQVAWQLAWSLDSLPRDADVSLIGYSYGARVVSGALHLLAGGRLGDLRLPQSAAATGGAGVRKPMNAALLAAALDADGMAPWGSYGRALHQVGRLVVLTNRRDPAMRFYTLSTPRSRTPALGYEGPIGWQHRGLAAQVRAIDVTREVGASHALQEYLSASGPLHAFLAAPPQPRPSAEGAAAEAAAVAEQKGQSSPPTAIDPPTAPPPPPPSPQAAA